ncbi:hypothetical protein ACRALDRAFT_206361 [Sodiomyces alcalophilus JCM 7366]|uniref:uncharacterized protein n=1 Tax=Sodiomyces alcalophilus JCM 7366 TaxID=591952 RepID=UPI0039B38263
MHIRQRGWGNSIGPHPLFDHSLIPIQPTIKTTRTQPVPLVQGGLISSLQSLSLLICSSSPILEAFLSPSFTLSIHYRALDHPAFLRLSPFQFHRDSLCQPTITTSPAYHHIPRRAAFDTVQSGSGITHHCTLGIEPTWPNSTWN